MTILSAVHFRGIIASARAWEVWAPGRDSMHSLKGSTASVIQADVLHADVIRSGLPRGEKMDRVIRLRSGWRSGWGTSNATARKGQALRKRMLESRPGAPISSTRNDLSVMSRWENCHETRHKRFRYNVYMHSACLSPAYLSRELLILRISLEIHTIMRSAVILLAFAWESDCSAD